MRSRPEKIEVVCSTKSCNDRLAIQPENVDFSIVWLVWT
jgi:hypothetical protein